VGSEIQVAEKPAEKDQGLVIPELDLDPHVKKVLCGTCTCRFEEDPDKRAVIELDMNQVMCPRMGAYNTWIHIPRKCVRYRVQK
jgi:hypothetical protein